MRRHAPLALALLAIFLQTRTFAAEDELKRSFADPPERANAWCYWWWLNGAASKEGITRDFEEMKHQGIAGALLFDAGTAGTDAPRGPHFMSPQWRELFKHAVREADRLGIVLGVNLCSGWNCGGAWVTPEHAAKKLVGREIMVKGPGRMTVTLPRPRAAQGFYRDIAVLACPMPDGTSPEPRLTASSSYPKYVPALAVDGQNDTRWISNGDKPGMGPTAQKPEHLQFDYAEPWAAAGLYLNPYSECGPKEIEIQCSDDGRKYRTLARATVAPRKETTVPFDEVAAKHFRVVFRSSYPYQGKEAWNVQVAEIALVNRAGRESPQRGRGAIWDRRRIVDLTESTDEQGRLTWDAPAGAWRVLRIGYTLHGRSIKCVGSGPVGLEIDPMDAAAMDAHFAETGAKLIADAGPLAGKSLQYFHIDSWELGRPTWTPAMRREFLKRRGYDPLTYLPALLGKTVDNAQTTQRFLADYRRTAADLVAANYYGRLRALTRKGRLRGTHPESGGPFFTHWIDALQCEGINDVPMGEFWKRNAEPDGPITWPPSRNPSVKQAACAAHIYAKPVCQAEAFTSFAPDWTADPWNMKDIGDEAFCHGLTRYVLCFWVHQPRPGVKPGYQWAHVGTHFDSNITWWDMSRAWLTYIARCQHMLRQGLFVADFAYFRGEDIPGFIAPRDQQKPMRPAGFDYDVFSAEVLLTRTAAKDGRLVLPDGMSYRYLVLPDATRPIISPTVLQKIKKLADAGVTVIGSKPDRAPGLTDYPHCDRRVRELADELWGEQAAPGQRKYGAGRVIAGRSLGEVVRADGLPPDVEFRDVTPQAKLDWIHRRDGEVDIYFLSNQTAITARTDAVFRVCGKQPELWDPVTGQVRGLPEWREEGKCTAVPLQLAPRQSFFVVFRNRANGETQTDQKNFPETKAIATLKGPWEVSFDTKWGGPKQVAFEKLEDWTKRPEDGIRYYSGAAVYRKQFRLPASTAARRLLLDLGAVKNLARVKLNGRDLGVVWTAPWRTEITDAVRQGENDLEIEVVNLWPNRIVADAALPKEKRYTVTNDQTYDRIKKSRRPANFLLPSGLLGPVTLHTSKRSSRATESLQER